MWEALSVVSQKWSFPIALFDHVGSCLGNVGPWCTFVQFDPKRRSPCISGSLGQLRCSSCWATPPSGGRRHVLDSLTDRVGGKIGFNNETFAPVAKTTVQEADIGSKLCPLSKPNIASPPRC